MYTLDTNTIIYYAAGDKKAVEFLDGVFERSVPLFISTISEIELFGFSRLMKEEADNIEKFLRAVTIIPLDSRIARIAAALRREYKIKTLDSAIAATTLATNSSLVMRNLRDFGNNSNLEIISV